MHADILEERSSTQFGPVDTIAARSRLTRYRLAKMCRQTLVVGLGAALLLWLALVNGRPSVFPDTALYYSQAEYLAGAVGLVSPQDNRVPAGDPTALPSRPGVSNVSVTIDGGRSPIYGLFVYGLERLGGLWLVAIAQAAMVAFILYALFRAAAPALSDLWYLLWMAAIAGLTSAPAFASFIMPDILGGVAGVAGLLVLIYWDQMAVTSRVATLGLLIFSLTVHRANLLALAGLTAAGATWLVLIGVSRRQVIERIAAIAVASLTASVVVVLAFQPINHRAGTTMRDPPFLMARIMADGPGRRYLQYACDHGSQLALCRFRHVPLEDSDTLLWSSRSTKGIFGVADYATRLKLEAQEHGFVIGALAYAPIDELVASGLNTLRQLGMTHVKSPLADPARFVDDGYWRRTSLLRIIPNAEQCRIWGRCGSKISPVALGTIQDIAMTLSMLTFVGCAGLLASRVKREPGPTGHDRRLLGLIVLTLAFVLANAVVCGALSAPVARYQARLIWMIPTLAMLIGGLLAAPGLAGLSKRGFSHIISLRFQRLSDPAT